MERFACDYCDRFTYGVPWVTRSKTGAVMQFCCHQCKDLFERAKEEQS